MIAGIVQNPDGSWLDTIENKTFSSKTTWYDDPSEFSFFTKPEDFSSDQRWGIPWTIKYLTAPTMLAYEHSTESIFSANIRDIFKGKRVLIIGGGPSALETQDIWKTSQYDVLATMNKGIHSALLKDIKVDFTIIGPEQDLRSEENLTYFERNDTMVCIEAGVSPIKSREEIQAFASRFPGKISYCHTRFFNKTGVGPRLVCLAGFCGASEITFAGIDGFPKLGVHSFENNKKHIGCANDSAERRYIRELFLWGQYLKEQFPGIKIKNLGYGKLYNQIDWEILGS